MNILKSFTTVSTATLLVAACAQQPAESIEARQATPVVDQADILPGADFSKYTKLTTDGLEIYFPERDGVPPAEDVARIRESFRRAFAEELAGNYEIVAAAGPDVMRVKAQLIDMKVPKGDGAEGTLSSLVAHGELTFLMEMSDSMSGTVLARASDRTKDVSTGEDAAEWAAVDRAAEHWASLFRNWLDDSLGKPGEER